ncbi:unnamed protein product, partial [Timema podura]|nr:unnamed protein product [Timema podura]
MRNDSRWFRRTRTDCVGCTAVVSSCRVYIAIWERLIVASRRESINYCPFPQLKLQWNNPSTPSVITVNDASSLGNFDSSHATKIVIHGWQSSATNMDEVRSAYMSSGEAVNVIMMDWSTGASNLVYEVCRERVVPSGEYLATLINFLVSKGMNTANLHIAGHSLGAHIAGVAGNRQTSGTVGRITGYINVPAANHLSSDDASFVEIIHTCAGLLGWADPLGHADFYPNGGTSPQPGCGVDVA